METKTRPTLTVFADDAIAAVIFKLNTSCGTDASSLYLYLSRAAPQTHRCGLFQCHPDYIARDTGIDQQLLINLIPNLEPHARFDAETWVWWIEELAEQYIRVAGNNGKHMTGVKHQIERIPDCELKDEAIQFWSQAPKWDESTPPVDTSGYLEDRNGMEGANPIANPIANPKVNSVVECGGGS
jgi:hypothetical protein